MKTLSWTEKDNLLVGEGFEFDSYLKMMEFIEKVALLAEARQHHPDFYVTYKKITFYLTTHEKKSLTKKDYDLAKDLEELYKVYSW